MADKKNQQTKRDTTGEGIGIGIALGAAAGLLFNNLALGIGLVQL